MDKQIVKCSNPDCGASYINVLDGTRCVMCGTPLNRDAAGAAFFGMVIGQRGVFSVCF